MIKKNVMYLPEDILKKAEGRMLRVNGLADILELELIPEYQEAAAV